ncbi:MAG: hypothetical protein RIB67_07240 [Miltoncostaeaceae bacterium]
MLIITEAAAAVLRNLLHRAPAANRGGLRLVANDDTPGEPGVQMSLISRPFPGDLVAIGDPLTYLASCSVDTLRDQVLDAGRPDDPTGLRLVPSAA